MSFHYSMDQVLPWFSFISLLNSFRMYFVLAIPKASVQCCLCFSSTPIIPRLVCFTRRNRRQSHSLAGVLEDLSWLEKTSLEIWLVLVLALEVVLS